MWPRFDSSGYVARWFDPVAWSCWHLVIEFYQRELGIKLPHYGLAYPDMDVTEQFRVAKASDWRMVDAVRFGDVVTFRHGAAVDGHAGVVVAPLTMLHVRHGTCSHLTRYDSRAWTPQLTGAFRWTG